MLRRRRDVAEEAELVPDERVVDLDDVGGQASYPV